MTVRIPTHLEVPIREAHDKYANTRNTEHEHYLLYNVREHSLFSLDLDNTVDESAFGATHPWVKARPIIFANNSPIFLPEDGEDNPNNTDCDKSVTLNLFNTTYNVKQTSITTIVTS